MVTRGNVNRSLNALPVGTVLRDYVIESELGSGGFSVVYLARHHHFTDWRYAIKEFLPGELIVRARDGTSVRPVTTEAQEAFEDGLRRFRNEAEQLQRFKNVPYIISCSNYFEQNGTAYLVMDYDDGLPLSKFLRLREEAGQPFAEEDLLAIVTPLLEGLTIVHRADVLHRDVKPGNIFVRRPDDIAKRPAHPVLLDFGAAKQNYLVRHSRSRAPYTPGYAAYEQASSIGEIGPWTDMYSIGALMWRMVAGGCSNNSRLALNERSPSPIVGTGEWSPEPREVEKRAYALNRGWADPMLPASDLGSGRFSPRLLNAIDRCLALYPEERVSSCKELAELLRETGTTSEGSKSERRNSAPALNTTKSELDSHEQIVDMEMPKHAPNSPEQNAQDSSETLMFTRGSYQDDVIRIQGMPAKIKAHPESGCEYWEYGTSTVAIDAKSRYVTGWSNEGGTLRVQLVPGDNATTTTKFTRGSHEDDVIRLQGTPTAIKLDSKTACENWEYGHSTVCIDAISRHVTRWWNKDGILQVRLVPGDSTTVDTVFDIGSHQDDVLRLQGTPTGIKLDPDLPRREEWLSCEGEGWYYGNSIVIIDDNTSVGGWWNTDGNLRIEDLVPGDNLTNSTTFTTGSHQDDVLRLQGMPTAITSHDEYTKDWYYGDSRVAINSTSQCVTGWWNEDGNLRIDLVPGDNVTNSTTFTTGSHQDDVLRLQGMPIGIVLYTTEELAFENWYYDDSRVEINSTSQCVAGWWNTDGNLRIEDLVPGDNVTNSTTFTTGSHQDDVLRIQGMPTATTSHGEYTKNWYYGDSRVKINSTSLCVTGWWNTDDNLRIEDLVPGDNVTNSTTFTTGSHQDDVLRLQGMPTGTERYYECLELEYWYYGDSKVEIDPTSLCVTGWWNEDGNLRIDLVPGDNVTNSTTFTTGSSQDDVLRLQGMPTAITPFDEYKFTKDWYYGDSIVTIDISSQCVTGWWNEDGNLQIEDLVPGDNVTNSTTFTTGSHQDDVLRLQGMPTAIPSHDEYEFTKDWYYGDSWVEINSTSQCVTGWWNEDGNLRIDLVPGDNVTNSTTFTTGSHQDDVLRLQGMPTKITSHDEYTKNWYYGDSKVEINSTSQCVTRWWNEDGNLRIDLVPGDNVTNSTTFTTGSHQNDVLRLQGMPTATTSHDGYTKDWYYGDSRVEINSTSQCVIGWWNKDGNLQIDLVPGDNVTNSATFTTGSHQDDVLRLQGMPTAITSYDEYTKDWYYGNSRVEINSTSLCVTGMWNKDGNLRIEDLAVIRRHIRNIKEEWRKQMGGMGPYTAFCLVLSIMFLLHEPLKYGWHSFNFKEFLEDVVLFSMVFFLLPFAFLLVFGWPVFIAKFFAKRSDKQWILAVGAVVTCVNVFTIFFFVLLYSD